MDVGEMFNPNYNRSQFGLLHPRFCQKKITSLWWQISAGPRQTVRSINYHRDNRRVQYTRMTLTKEISSECKFNCTLWSSANRRYYRNETSYFGTSWYIGKRNPWETPRFFRRQIFTPSRLEFIDEKEKDAPFFKYLPNHEKRKKKNYIKSGMFFGSSQTGSEALKSRVISQEGELRW
jgi:hypothetical protein